MGVIPGSVLISRITKSDSSLPMKSTLAKSRQPHAAKALSAASRMAEAKASEIFAGKS